MNPENRQCQNCKQAFTIEPADFDFYKKMDVPPPTFCPDCRRQRRLSWRNERALYKRGCDLCKKVGFSMYPEGTSFPVYCHDCWFSDKWDPLDFGRDYDFFRDFFSQFNELKNIVPRIALQVENVVNSPYTNQVLNMKNCYLVTSSVNDEDCMFGYRVLYSRNILDSFSTTQNENVYEGSMGRESANVFYAQGFADSHELYFCDEPRGCQSCFMTSNLRRKSYVFRGEQLSKEEYGKRLAAEDLGSYQAVQRLWKEFDALVAGSIRPHGTFKNAVNTTGNGVANTSDCSYVFHGTELENCHYAIFLDNANDCMDINNGGHGMELVYETCTAGAGAYNSKFCVDAWPEVSNLTYCDSCRSGAADLFGCISLRGKQYCILNKQYSKEEYRDLVGRIMQQMKEVPYRDKNGRVYVYGEFFPSELSPFPYNDSMAQDFFQLTPETAEAQGFRWNAQIEKNVRISTPAESLPDHIRDVDDAILNEVVGCLHKGECNDRCSVGFRITPDELRFYRRYDIPLPRLCPNCRSYVRLKRRNPFTLWDRQCMCDKGHAQHLGGRCDITFKTNCIPEKGETVYCEHCYNLEVS